jgi:hypothetical protein
MLSDVLPRGTIRRGGQRSAGSVVTDCAIQRDFHSSVSGPGGDPSECSCQ